jgi:DNA-binding transcriptional regulator LsrR (DeoR family)
MYYDYICGIKQVDIAKKHNISCARLSLLLSKSKKSESFQLKFTKLYGNLNKSYKFSDRNLNIYHDYKCGIKQVNIAKKYNISEPRVSTIIYKCNLSNEFQLYYNSIYKK